MNLKTAKDIREMREGGVLLARILSEVAVQAKPGTTTKKLDSLAKDLILRGGAKTAFLGYQGFPGVLCTAVNEEGVHTPPSKRKLEEGDILVTSMTRPEFVSGMKKAGGLITDEGGITCHAAIVAREYGIPAVMATGNGTKKLKDGDVVVVIPTIKGGCSICD